MRRRRCRPYRSRLAEAAERGATADLALRRHLRTCSACRRELAQHRAIGRALRRLAPADVTVGPRDRSSRFGRAGQVAAGGVGALGLVAALAYGARRRSG